MLGSMLLSTDAIADVVEVLRGADFYRPTHETLFDAIVDLYGRGEPVDAVTVADHLTKRGSAAEAGRGAVHPRLAVRCPAGCERRLLRRHRPHQGDAAPTG